VLENFYRVNFLSLLSLLRTISLFLIFRRYEEEIMRLRRQLAESNPTAAASFLSSPEPPPRLNGDKRTFLSPFLKKSY
jgi:hypothetical protein